MKNSKLLFILLLTISFTACLKKDLPVTTNSNLNNISDFNLIYKYQDTVVDNPGTPNENTRILVRTVQLNKVVSISNDTVYVTPTFSSDFPQKQKSKVTLKNIWGLANIPDAATIAPVGGAPRLGAPGDFSSPVSYDVKAANGAIKRWVVSVASLPVVNQWEGTYIETGTLTHASAGLQTCPANFTQNLVTVNANTVKATAGFWYFNNSGITYLITVNPNNSVTISSDPTAAVVIQQEATPASTYDPVAKKFTLYYYYYSGGDPANWRRFATVFTLK